MWRQAEWLSALYMHVDDTFSFYPDWKFIDKIVDMLCKESMELEAEDNIVGCLCAHIKRRSDGTLRRK